MLVCRNIKKSYQKLEVLKDISLEIKKAEVVSIVGSSGAGKSTLLHILGTLDKPDSGNIIFNGTELSTLKDTQLAKLRNEKIGFVFQFHNLLPEFTALENICIPAMIGARNEKETQQRARFLMEKLGIIARESHKPSELSGGEQQRVAIARALINSPDIVFADEPSGNLDSKNAEELHKLIFQLRGEFAQAFVIVTHNTELANMADRKIEMQDGKILVQE